MSHQVTTVARRAPTRSRIASASAATTGRVYASYERGRPDRPLPRGSNVTTRACRDRYGTCSFQQRECTISHVGISSTVRGPSPYTS